MKRTAIVFLVLTLSGCFGAKAQQFDLSTMTCESFIKTDKDQMKLIAAWLAGYYTDAPAAQVVDAAAISKVQDDLIKFCTRETSFPVATAAEGILGH